MRKEWKEHCAFGFVLSQLIWRTKLAKIFEKRKLVEVEETEAEIVQDEEINLSKVKEHAEKCQIDNAQLLEVLDDLVQHMYENDYL